MPPRQPVFVGDVQGCADELDELLERARAAFGDGFELWVVGDLINRGPYNLRALSRVRELVEAGRGHYVLGNHELILLRIAAGQQTLSELDSVGDVLGSSAASDWIEWLRRRPLMLGGRIGGQRFAMVHAGVHPDWGFEELTQRARAAEQRLGGPDQAAAERFLAADPAGDPDREALEILTHCRSVTAAGAWSSEPPELLGEAYRPWHEAWAARGHGYGVVYGHWALQGLHVAPWLRGLDTGCVHHGRGRRGVLTAWLPDPTTETPFAAPDENLWEIPARRPYYLQRDAAG